MECILSRMDPMEVASVYKEAFHMVLREGVIDRHKTILNLREWAAMNTIVGSDVSWCASIEACLHNASQGIGATIASAMGITPLELEDPVALRLDLSESKKRERAEAGVRTAMEASQALKATHTFRAFDDGTNPMFMMVHEAPSLEAAGDGRYLSLRATNAAYETWFHASAAEIVGNMLQRKMLGSLISTIMFDPGDRLAYLVSSVRTLFASDQGSSTQFLKCQTRKGSIRAYLFKVIRTLVDGLEATVITIESLPKASRYVKNCPDIRKRVYSFRKEELPPDEEQEQEQGEEHDHPDAAWEAVLQQVAELCDTGDAAWSLPGSWSAPTSPTAPRPPLPMLIPQLSAPPFGALTLPPLACIPTGAGLEEGEAILEAKGAEGVSALFTPGSHFHAWGRMKNTPTTL